MSFIRTRITVLTVLLSSAIALTYVWAFFTKSYAHENDPSGPTILEVENLQLQRKLHVANMCRSLNKSDTIMSLPSSLLDHIIVDDEHKLIYCFVPKVACTNWKRVLLVLRGVKDNPLSISGNETHVPNLFKTLNQYSSSEINDKLMRYMKFMFVRHPYERILSAYRNKFEAPFTNYFRLHFGTEIIKGYRNKPSQESLLKGHDVKFHEFLEYIVNLSPKNHKILLNEHWRPAFDLCHPCHISYDVLGKYNTLGSDAQYVLWKAGLDDLVKFPTRERSYKMKPTTGVIFNYYKNISNDLQEKLYRVYEDDFIFFEYDPEQY